MWKKKKTDSLNKSETDKTENENLGLKQKFQR